MPLSCQRISLSSSLHFLLSAIPWSHKVLSLITGFIITWESMSPHHRHYLHHLSLGSTVLSLFSSLCLSLVAQGSSTYHWLYRNSAIDVSSPPAPSPPSPPVPGCHRRPGAHTLRGHRLRPHTVVISGSYGEREAAAIVVVRPVVVGVAAPPAVPEKGVNVFAWVEGAHSL